MLMKDKLFLQSSSTYFAKPVVLTWESQLCSVDKLVYCPSWNAYWETNICAEQDDGYKYAILKRCFVKFLWVSPSPSDLGFISRYQFPKNTSVLWCIDGIWIYLYAKAMWGKEYLVMLYVVLWGHFLFNALLVFWLCFRFKRRKCYRLKLVYVEFSFFVSNTNNVYTWFKYKYFRWTAFHFLLIQVHAIQCNNANLCVFSSIDI